MVRESLISMLREKNRDSHFSEDRAALVRVCVCVVFFMKLGEKWLPKEMAKIWVKICVDNQGKSHNDKSV